MDKDDIKNRIIEMYQQLQAQGICKYQEVNRDRNAETFRKFWEEKICNDGYGEFSIEKDLDPVIRLIDVQAKGVDQERDCPIGRIYIYQTLWYRIFKDFHAQKNLRNAMNDIFQQKDDAGVINSINFLQKINENNKNGLTGKSANALNAIMTLRYPRRWLSMVSLDHRYQAIRALDFGDSGLISNKTYGEQIVLSNKLIVDGFRNKFDLDIHVRFMSLILYKSEIKPFWQEAKSDSKEDIQEEVVPKSDPIIDENAFAMERHLEDFLIANWEKTELGKKFDLITEDGDMVSKQYHTDIGNIDILVQDKNTGSYVVIELKKGQPSDDVVGQVLRYMGWIAEHVANKKEVRGLIIALEDDDRLKYALKPLEGRVGFYRYKVQFELVEVKN